MRDDERQQRIKILERIVESERHLISHPRFGLPSRRLLLQAERELRDLRARPVLKAR